MLRRILVSVLTLLYCASAIGVPLHFHYCRGELKHITLFVKKECHVPDADNSQTTCCRTATSHCNSGVASINSCCDDATQWLQEHTPAVCHKAHDLLPASEACITDLCSSRLTHEIQITTPVSAAHANMPTGPPLFLLQCALIFYG